MEKARRVPAARGVSKLIDECDEGRPEMCARVVAESVEDLVHASALHTDATTVHEAQFTQADRMRLAHVRIDDVRDVARCERMEIELRTDRDDVVHVTRGAGPLLLAVTCRDRRPDAAARREVTDHRHADGRADRHEIIEDLIGQCLVEHTLVAEVEQVVLE
jgi:hypothetical protein